MTISMALSYPGRSLPLSDYHHRDDGFKTDILSDFFKLPFGLIHNLFHIKSFIFLESENEQGIPGF